MFACMRKSVVSSYRSAVLALLSGGLALPGLVSPSLAQSSGRAAGADIVLAVQAFDKQCLEKLPNLPRNSSGFRTHGYTEPTEDPKLFGRPGGGLAGLGETSAGDETKSTDQQLDAKKPDGKPELLAGPFKGCVVYIKGLDTAPVIKAIDAAATRRFKKSKRMDDGKDYYLAIGDHAPKGFLVIVSAKSEGRYAGHTMIMAANLDVPKPSPAKPADKDKLADAGPLDHKGPGGIIETPAKAPLKRALGAIIPDAPIERAKLLRDLYAHLATATDEQAAAPHVEAIERLWLSPGSDTVLALMERALFAASHDRADLALNLLDAVTTIAPDYAEGFNRRAYVFYTLGDRERALGDLRRVLALDPNHFKAIDGFAQIMKDYGDKKAAFAAYQKLISIHPFWPSAQAAHDELKKEVEGQGL
jgi:tetratricopeptide (TPR) repeat protein